MTATPTLPHAIAAAIESALIDVHTAMVCKVQTWDPDTQTADLVPQVQRPLEELATGNIVHEDLPILPNVPIAFPRSASFFVSFPLSAGDFVLVIFNEYSIDQWREKGRVTAPGDIGHLTLTGAIGIPVGPYPDSQALAGAPPTDMVVGHDGGAQVHIKPGGTVEVTSAGGETADDFVAQGGKVTSALDILKDLFDNWTPSAQDGGAALKTAWGLVTGSFDTDVASSNLKSDD